MSGPVPELTHRFVDPELLQLALTHASFGLSRDNERLEFLGDAVLDMIVAEELYRHHLDLPEGDLTELKADVVSRRTLAEAARRLALADHARVGPGLRSRALPRSVLANLYEAVLGAIYLDAGLEPARTFALTTLRAPIERVRSKVQRANPKQRLQQFCQKQWGGLPRYTLLESRGEAHARAFLVACDAGGRRHPSAWGRTRKEAESWAAHEALLVLDDPADIDAGPADRADARVEPGLLLPRDRAIEMDPTETARIEADPVGGQALGAELTDVDEHPRARKPARGGAAEHGDDRSPA